MPKGKRNPTPLKKQNAMTVTNVAAYLEAKAQRFNSTFVICPAGFFYHENGELTPALEFERRRDLVIDTRTNDNLDTTKSWMK